MTKTLARLALTIVLGLSARTALAQVQPAAPARTQVKAGDDLMNAGRYAEAAQQYEAGYAIDPDVAILERLAEAYRFAGNTAAYNSTRQRIAAAQGNLQAPPPPPPGYAQQPPPPGYAPSPPPEGYAPPPPAYTPPPPGYAPGPPVYYAPYRPYHRRYYPYYARPRIYAYGPGQRLLGIGIALLASGYAASAITGGIAIGINSTFDVPQPSWYGAGGMMFIPVVGPFASIAFRQDAVWAAPVALIGGGLQVTGLALTIAGAVIRHNRRAGARRADAKELPFTILPYSNPQSSGLMMVGRF